MSEIKVTNVLKVLDIHQNQVHNATIHHLVNFHTIYQDKVLKENLVNVEDAIEEFSDYAPQDKQIKKTVKRELGQLSTLLRKHSAAYVRFIN